MFNLKQLEILFKTIIFFISMFHSKIEVSIYINLNLSQMIKF